MFYRYFRNIFMLTFFLIYYDSKKKIRIKIDVFNFALTEIINQQNNNDN